MIADERGRAGSVDSKCLRGDERRCPKVVGIAIQGKTYFQHTGEPTPSRYARQPLPEEGARMWGVLSVSIPPSFGRRCPQGGGWVTQGGVKDDVRLSIFLGKYGSIAVRFYF